MKEKLLMAATAGATVLTMGFGASSLAFAQTNSTAADNTAPAVSDANIASANGLAQGFRFDDRRSGDRFDDRFGRHNRFHGHHRFHHGHHRFHGHHRGW